MPIYDYSKLKGKIIEVFGSQGEFANALGKTEQYVSRVLNNKTYLNQDEIEVWCTLLNINDLDIPVYFFTH